MLYLIICYCIYGWLVYSPNNISRKLLMAEESINATVL